MKCWVAVIVLAVSGCSGEKSARKTPEQVKKEWSAKVQAKLQKIAAAAVAGSAAELGAPVMTMR
jgi:hypothetical protein